MTTTGSSIISALGAGSGINFTTLANDLSAASFAGQRQAITDRNAALEARISAAASLRNMVMGLAASVGNRVRTGELSPRATLGNPALAEVTFTPGVTPTGSYTLEVSQLATEQRLVMPPLGQPGDPVGTGSLTLRFGTITGSGFAEAADRPALAIAVAAGDTLETVAARITSASEGAIQAQVLAGTGGAQLVLTGREGAANAFVVEAAGTGPLASLGWEPASPGAVQVPAMARDALLAVNGVAMRSASNRVAGLPEGLGLHLKAASPGQPTTLTITTDTSAVTRVMEDLVAALNDVVREVQALGNPVGGALGNDPALRQLRQALGRVSGEVVMPGAEPGAPQSLADLGLVLGRDGTFRLDAARLARAQTDAPRAVAAMFTSGAFGVFGTLDRLARNATQIGDVGTLGGAITRFQRQVQANTARLDTIAEQQERLRQRLSRAYAASERRVGASQSTLTFLRQQVDIWNAQRR